MVVNEALQKWFPHTDINVMHTRDIHISAGATAGSIHYILYYSASTHIQPMNNPKLNEATHNMLSASV